MMKDESDISPAKQPRKENDRESKFSKLLGDLFSHDKTVGQPPRMAASEKVERELSLYRAEQPAGLDFNPLK